MSELLTLPLTDGQGDPLAHKFYTHGEASKGLLIIFPGSYYGVDGPALYYPAELLDHAGWDTLAITYGFQSRGEPFATDEVPNILQECAGVMRQVLAERQYPRIVLMGKSLGCGVVTFLAQVDENLKDALTIYLTPPLGTAGFDPMFGMTQQPSLLALGSQDRFYTPEALEALREKRSFELIFVDDVDHSFDKAGDLEISIQAVATVVRGVMDFIAAHD